MRLLLAVLAASLPVAGAAPLNAQQHWPMWRGPDGTGASRQAQPPLEWSETRNVRWKVEIPGRGSASPVVWGDRLFVQSAIPASAASGDASHAPRGALQPRDDGRVLAGSTEEEVGFDKRTTQEATAELAAFARDLVPALTSAPIEQTWAGLRPATFDGLPYLGPLPGLFNAFVAAGHFRSGLYLSPATAVVMSQLIRGERPEVDLDVFRVGR